VVDAAVSARLIEVNMTKPARLIHRARRSSVAGRGDDERWVLARR
jgi:hypothetical protein